LLPKAIPRLALPVRLLFLLSLFTVINLNYFVLFICRSLVIPFQNLYHRLNLNIASKVLVFFLYSCIASNIRWTNRSYYYG